MKSQLLRIAERHLASADPQGQRNAVAALGAIGGPEAAAALARACARSPHAEVQALALDRLVEREPAERRAAAEVLAEHLRGDHPELQRRRAWRALAGLRVRAGVHVADLGPLPLRLRQAFEAAPGLVDERPGRSAWGGLQAWWFVATVTSAAALAIGLLHRGEDLLGPSSVVGLVVALSFAPLGVAALATLLRARVAPEHHHADPWIGWAWSVLASAAWTFVVTLLGLGIAASVHAAFRGAGLDHVRLVEAVLRGASVLSVAVAAVQLGVLAASRVLSGPALSQALQVGMGGLAGLVAAHLLLGGPPGDVESFTLIVAGAVTIGAALARRGIAGAVRPHGAALAVRGGIMGAILVGVTAMVLSPTAQPARESDATARHLAAPGDFSVHELGAGARLVLRPTEGATPPATEGCDDLVAIPSTLYEQEADTETRAGRVLRVYSLPDRDLGAFRALRMVLGGNRLESATPLSSFTGPIALPFPTGRYAVALDDLDTGSFASLLYPPDPERSPGMWVGEACGASETATTDRFVDRPEASVDALVRLTLDATQQRVDLPVELRYPRRLTVALPDVKARQDNPLLSRDRQGLVQAMILPASAGGRCPAGDAEAVALAELREGALDASLPAGEWCLRLAARGGARASSVSIGAAAVEDAIPVGFDRVERRLDLPEVASARWLARVPYPAATRPRPDPGQGRVGRLEAVLLDLHQRAVLHAALPGLGSAAAGEGASPSPLAAFVQMPATATPLALRLLDEAGREVERAEDPPALSLTLAPGRYWLEPELRSADAAERGLAEDIELRLVVEGRGAGWTAKPCGHSCELDLPPAASLAAVVATGLARGRSSLRLAGVAQGRWYRAAVRGAPTAQLAVRGADAALAQVATGTTLWLRDSATLDVQADGEALALWLQPIAGTSRVPYVDTEPVEAWVVPTLIGETLYLEGKGRVDWTIEVWDGAVQTGGGTAAGGRRALRPGDTATVRAPAGQVVTLTWTPPATGSEPPALGDEAARPGLLRVVGTPIR